MVERMNNLVKAFRYKLDMWKEESDQHCLFWGSLAHQTYDSVIDDHLDFFQPITIAVHGAIAMARLQDIAVGVRVSLASSLKTVDKAWWIVLAWPVGKWARTWYKQTLVAETNFRQVRVRLILRQLKRFLMWKTKRTTRSEDLCCHGYNRKAGG